MAIVKKIVVKEGWEEIYEVAKTRLENIDTDIETKVAAYREELVTKSIDDRTRFQSIIDNDCTKEIEVEVPDEEIVAEGEEVAVATDIVE